MTRCRGCLTVNGPRRRKCQACKRALPKKRRPDHMKALDLPREAFVAANDGYDGCWICRDLGESNPHRRVVRDHWHTGEFAGEPRGLACDYHNRLLGPRYSAVLLASLTRYVSRRSAA